MQSVAITQMYKPSRIRATANHRHMEQKYWKWIVMSLSLVSILPMFQPIQQHEHLHISKIALGEGSGGEEEM